MNVDVVNRETLPYSCTDCGEPHNRKRRHKTKSGESTVTKQSKCGPCHAAYMRKNRKSYCDLSPEEKKKSNCRSHTKTLVKRGKLKKQPCEVCGSEKVEAHHDDYDKPAEVRWLCKVHHVDLHKGTLTFWQAMGLEMLGELD